MPNQLPVNRLVNVSVQLTPQAARAQNLSTLLVLTNTNVVDTVEMYRTYGSYSELLKDFATTSGAALAASLYFAQNPQPRQIMIGLYRRSAVAGGLRCAPRSAGNMLKPAAWTSITAGAFAVQIDGAAAVQVTACNFSTVLTMEDVAAVVTTRMTGATCTWDAVRSRFTIRSNATGGTSSISFLTAPASGFDISDDLGGTSAQSGSYTYQGAGAQSFADAVTTFDTNFGQLWYAVTYGHGLLTPVTDTDMLNAAAAVQAMTNKHLLFANTEDAATLLSANTTDLAYVAKQAGYSRLFLQYDSGLTAVGVNSAASAAAKLLGVNYDGSNTVLTLMYKQQPGVTPEQLTSTQADALDAKNCNVFVGYDNDTAILQRGTVSSGEFADNIAFLDWLATTIQTTVFSVLYTSTTKIPQTDAGTHILLTAIEAVLRQGVVNGGVAPGQWNGDSFGTLTTGDYLNLGFYLYAPPVATQSSTDRTARKSVPIQIAVKLAGATHTVDVAITVNQ